MRGILHPYGPLMTTLGKIGDAVILNFLILLFSLPVVTMGAAVTAGHYTALKVIRNEDKIFSDFWKSFRENFKQATMIWLSMILLMAIFTFGGRMLGATGEAVGFVLSVLTLAVSLWVFPVLSKFVNTTANIIRNGIVLSLGYFLRTLAMLVSYFILPPVIFFSIQLLPVVLLFGLSVPVLIGAMLYNSVFAKMEAEVQENQSA